MLLARSGLRVLLLDRVDFPRDTLSSHLLQPRGVAALADWGLLEGLLGTGCPPITRWTADLAPDVVPTHVGSTEITLSPRRTVLDELLVRAAVEAGAEFRARAAFLTPLWDHGRVNGVRYASGGREYTEHARLVVGADGTNSTVARTVGARFYQDLGVITCTLYGYYSGPPDRGARLFVRETTFATAVPTHGGQHCITLSLPHRRFGEIRSDADRHFTSTIAELAPELSDEIATGRRLGPLRGCPGVPNRYRESAGPGWALIGDAGLTTDPLTGLGMSDAFAQAASLAGRVHAAWDDGPDAVDTAVADHAEDRDTACADSFTTNATLARSGYSSPLLDAFRKVQHHPEAGSRLNSMLTGRVSLAEFMTWCLLTGLRHDTDRLSAMPAWC